MTADSSVTPVRFLIIGIWTGLITGLAEVSLLAFDRFYRQRYILLSRDVVWMAPLADALLFTLVGLLLLGLARLSPKFISLKVVAFTFSFLGFLSLMVMFPKLHWLASCALAAGLAVQTARLIAKRGQGFQRIVRRSAGWVIAVVLVSAVGMNGWQMLGERRALANLPPAPSQAPNVLLIVMDTVRAKSLSLYGYERATTPRLKQFAQTGTLFEKAIATAPWTLPTHASMFTGRFHHELSVDWAKPLDGAHPTLAEVLSANGYATSGFVANLSYCGYEVGLDRGFLHYEDYPISAGQIVLSSSLGRTITNSGPFRRLVDGHEQLNRKNAAQVNEDFLRWLPSVQGQRPFFAFLNYYDAHQPYLPPKPFDEKFGPAGERGDFRYMLNLIEIEDWNRLSPQQKQVEHDAYDAAIAYLDDQIGTLIAQLEERGLRNDTLIIITADHGEQFGEHELFSHGNSLYMPLLQVPLLISFPSRVPAATNISEAVSLRNIPATVLDLIGLKSSIPFPGATLARYWVEPKVNRTPPELLLSEALVIGGDRPGNMKSLLVDKYHYIKNGDGSEELYDIENDPPEKQDLSVSEEGRAALKEFRSALEAVLAVSQSAN